MWDPPKEHHQGKNLVPLNWGRLGLIGLGVHFLGLRFGNGDPARAEFMQKHFTWISLAD